MKAKFREDIRERYLKGRNTGCGKVQIWADFLGALAGTEVPVQGAYHEQHPDRPTRLLVVLDVSGIEELGGIQDLYIEPDLIEITDAKIDLGE